MISFKYSRLALFVALASSLSCVPASVAKPPEPPGQCSKLDGAPQSAAAAGPLRLDANQVVAEWKGGKITYGELLGAAPRGFAKLRAAQARGWYLQEHRGLRDMIAGRLIAQAAAAAGKNKRAYLQASIGVIEVSDEEAKALYEAQGRESGESFETMEPMLRGHIQQKKLEAAFNDLVERLQRDGQAKLKLPAPPQARVELDLEGRPSKGAAGAAVTIVLFEDFQCPYCSQMGPAANKLLKAFPSQLRVVYMHFPLSFHKQAKGAAVAAQCANLQGKFWPMHDQLYANQKKLLGTAAGMRPHAEAAGLNLAAFDKCMVAPAARQLVADDMKQAEEAGVEGTPSVFINGIPNEGLPTVAELRLMMP